MDYDKCDACDHCKWFISGLPEAGYIGVQIPQWIQEDADVLNLITQMVKECPQQAFYWGEAD
ncbi:MAG: hypothetical protein KGY70_19695 [Bacteroidales bacterium]|nr:hypothetical protein [Bacteroidales bacterium]